MGAKAKELIKLVAEHGSLEAYERHVAEQESKGQHQLTKHYSNQADFVADMPLMQAKGWKVLTQTQGPAHTTMPRVGTGMVVGGVLTGGIGAAFGGALGAASKKKSGLAVLYGRRAPAES